MSKILSELHSKETFTLKRDFNMTGFLLKAKPDDSFKVAHEGDDNYIRTNTFSNVKLKNNVNLTEADIVGLIEDGKKVLIFYELEKRLDAYNYKDSMKLLSWVVAS